eukprot:88275_1
MPNDVLDVVWYGGGNSLAIIIIIVLMYLLYRSFQKRETSLSMKVSVMLVFVGILAYDIATIINKLFIPRTHCATRNAMAQVPFLFTRGTMYYFFIIRMEVSFLGSDVAFSTTFIKALKIITVVVYSTSALYMSIWYRGVYVEERNLCLALDLSNKDAVFYMTLIINIIFAVTDLMLGIIISVSYLQRLWGLYKEMKVMTVAGGGEYDRPNKKLKHLIIKQAKLAYIAYISTIVFVYVGPPMGLTHFNFFDSIVNALCVFCVFNFTLNSRVYQVFCNCNGAKWPQYACGCLCCGCCCYVSGSEASDKVDDETNTTKGSRDRVGSGSDVNPSDMSASSDGDVTQKTVEIQTDICV